jgi:required for meiotic nuclear division protein 1
VEDKPDVLWNHPDLVRLYLQLAQEFDLQERSAALERKLALVGTTVETVMGLMESRRTLVLEVAVASPIAIEVGTTVYDLFGG